MTVMVLIMLSASAHADQTGFNNWLYQYKQRIAGQGMNRAFIDRALANVQFLPRVIELDQKQPENKTTFAQYKKNIVSDVRIHEGRKQFAKYRTLLYSTGKKYGVQPQYIVALWGIETHYGNITGNFDILSSLATLAYEGRRAEFFESELTKALQVLDTGHTGTRELKGSWAGAMGQSQFMPGSYLKYAVDGDGDGIINIWSNMADVFASMANYLHTEGWNPDLRWGRAVQVPKAVPESAYGRDNKKPLSYWKKMGVTGIDGQPLVLPADGSDPMAGLVAPDGFGMATYLVYPNYDVIMHWNRSTYFATSVGLLADAISAGGS
jgi:membrane-bound lytic murein transglycosylase B